MKPCPKHAPSTPLRNPRPTLGALGGADPAVGMRLTRGHSFITLALNPAATKTCPGLFSTISRANQGPPSHSLQPLAKSRGSFPSTLAHSPNQYSLHKEAVQKRQVSGVTLILQTNLPFFTTSKIPVPSIGTSIPMSRTSCEFATCSRFWWASYSP